MLGKIGRVHKLQRVRGKGNSVDFNLCTGCWFRDKGYCPNNQAFEDPKFLNCVDSHNDYIFILEEVIS